MKLGQSIRREVLGRLQQCWPDVEELLLSVAKIPGFTQSLTAYRGTSLPSGLSPENPSQAVFLKTLEKLFEACFSGFASQEILSNKQLLNDFEKAFNLALYYWFGLDDRNFQFRTIIHFLEISPEPRVLRLSEGTLSWSVQEWGISFFESSASPHFPLRASLSKVCGISQLRMKLPLADQDQKRLFSSARLVQREFCLLIDEWEYSNSILAVKQFSVRKMPQSEIEQARNILSTLAHNRDQLALWCVESASDFQRFIARAWSITDLTPDTRAEVEAADRVLLSGFQKFLLPASVSRHVYSKDVLRELLRFIEARLEHAGDDLFSLIAELSFSAALQQEVSPKKIIDLISKRSFEWMLSADPSAAVKAVSWGLAPVEHRFFTAILVVVYDSKLSPDTLDSHWIQTLASVVEMPGTFDAPPKATSTLRIDRTMLEKLNTAALHALDKSADKMRDENLKLTHFVREFLQSDLPDADATWAVSGEEDSL